MYISDILLRPLRGEPPRGDPRGEFLGEVRGEVEEDIAVVPSVVEVDDLLGGCEYFLAC